jgi:hypothetical protein
MFKLYRRNGWARRNVSSTEEAKNRTITERAPKVLRKKLSGEPKTPMNYTEKILMNSKTAFALRFNKALKTTINASSKLAVVATAGLILVGCGGGGGGGALNGTPNNYLGHFAGTLSWTDTSNVAHTTTVSWTVDTNGRITGTDTFFGNDLGTVTNQGAIDVFVGQNPSSSSPQIVAFFRAATVNVAGSLVTTAPVSTVGLQGTLIRS